jgi:hypothetical protein
VTPSRYLSLKLKIGTKSHPFFLFLFCVQCQKNKMHKKICLLNLNRKKKKEKKKEKLALFYGSISSMLLVWLSSPYLESQTIKSMLQQSLHRLSIKSKYHKLSTKEELL